MSENLVTMDASHEGFAPIVNELAPDVFVMPCSISQQRFWLLEQLSPGNTALNIPLAVQLSGPLDVTILERALDAIVARHEVLRTGFAQVEGAPKQVIRPEAKLKLSVLDLTGVVPEQRDVRIKQEMIAEAERPLKLDHPPILRTTLLRLAPGENVLMLTIHHIVGDGWSNGLLVREVGVFYDALVRGVPANLVPLSFQYADYAIWQEEWVKTAQFQEQLNFWKQTLDGDLPVLDFPTDFPRQIGLPYTAFIESLLLPASLTEALKRLCVDLDVTLFMVLFSAYVTLLHRYTGQDEFIIGTTAGNRNRSEMEALIGLFANPLILRPSISGEMTFRQVTASLRDHSLDCFAHQEVPFEIVLEQMQERKKGGRKPVIQTHFLYQKAFMEPAAYGDLVIRPLRSVSPGSTFELTYGVVERAEGIRLQMEFHTALYKNTTIRRMLEHFQTILESAIHHPDQPIDEMTLMPDEELEKLWPASGAQPTVATEVALDVPSILKDLEKQLDDHLRQPREGQIFGAVINPPQGTTLITLDDEMRVLPAGVPGHLYLGGTFPESTDSPELVLGPADSESPVPLVATDFQSCNRENGKVEVRGREKDFTRIGGFQVNLRQVKACLSQHPGVVQAVVAVIARPTDEPRLIGYVVPRTDAAPTEKELREFLKGKVSDYAVPTHVLSIASIPMDERGVVQTGSLPKPLAPARPSEDAHVPLQGILHQQLIGIWQDILKVPGIMIDDNFFALGGSSLLALRMMSKIEKLCGRPLPLSLLLTGATISNLARFIVDTNNESSPPLIPVQPKGALTPFFFLHGDWAGGGYYCGRFAEELGDNQPFFAIPPYRSGREEVLTVEDMARHHLAAIRKQAPHGPYLLGGYCIGATVVVEMARQLHEEGEEVTHLFLIDPPLWGGEWLRWVWTMVDTYGNARQWSLGTKIAFYDRYCVSFNRWLKRPASAKINSILRRIGRSSFKPVNPDRAVTTGRDPNAAGDEEILTSMDYAVYFLAYRLYRLKPIHVPATLFFPESIRASRLSWILRKSERAPVRCLVRTLPGNHHTCVTKHTNALAERMRETLDTL